VIVNTETTGYIDELCIRLSVSVIKKLVSGFGKL